MILQTNTVKKKNITQIAPQRKKPSQTLPTTGTPALQHQHNAGDSECLPGSGLYCETVIRTRDKLMVYNALADPEWKDNPDIKLALISSNAKLRDALEKVSDLSEQLERAAGTDHLTGLMNRRTFDKLIASIQANEQITGKSACFVLFDLDHFKKVNDAFGHNAGDAALRLVAETIKQRSRQGDMIWRWGGEEFLVVLPATPLEGGVKFGEELRGALEGEPITHKGGQRHITISSGVSVLAKNEDPYACLERCDALMYEAKEAGRNRVKAR